MTGVISFLLNRVDCQSDLRREIYCFLFIRLLNWMKLFRKRHLNSVTWNGDPAEHVWSNVWWNLNSDPRVEKWPLMASPVPTLLFTFAYLLVVYYGRRWMKNRKPFSLRYILVPYNLSMCLLNFYIALEVSTVRSNQSLVIDFIYCVLDLVGSDSIPEAVQLVLSTG